MSLNLWSPPRRFPMSFQAPLEFRRHRVTGKWEQREPGALWEVCGPIQSELLNELLGEPLWVLYLWEFLGCAAGVALALFFGWLILNI